MRLTQALYLMAVLAAVMAAEIGDRKRQQHGGRPTSGGTGDSVAHHKEAPPSVDRGKSRNTSAWPPNWGSGGGSGGGSGSKGGRDAEGCGGGKRPMRPKRLNFTEANKHIECLIKKKYKKAKEALKKPSKPSRDQVKQKACHSMAMLRCGCTALSKYEDELNRSKTVALETKCSIRAEFFRCVDESEKSHCRHPNTSMRALKPKSSYRSHMKEIVRVLWSTRGCLLGADDGLRTNKVNSAFCAKINGSGGGGKGGGGRRKGNKAKPKSS